MGQSATWKLLRTLRKLELQSDYGRIKDGCILAVRILSSTASFLQKLVPIPQSFLINRVITQPASACKGVIEIFDDWSV